ncbi:hypothetical protein P154DRAFT_574904 [Amniculicola lignicola CBS 123094]|uniref:Uncharacterized protein n=1 Tax=Amniculicola lignicola CBS 123094 TaxID=1392246 RepID=A0A6A5WJD4_9PLEO|nr:hypothetical protein P154DRAFT_574904 [Amniculicola lignicola CBS 123094]
MHIKSFDTLKNAAPSDCRNAWKSFVWYLKGVGDAGYLLRLTGWMYLVEVVTRQCQRMVKVLHHHHYHWEMSREPPRDNDPRASRTESMPTQCRPDKGQPRQNQVSGQTRDNHQPSSSRQSAQDARSSYVEQNFALRRMLQLASSEDPWSVFNTRRPAIDEKTADS